MRIPYGRNSTNVAFKEERHVRVVSPKQTPPSPGAIRQSLSRPVNFKEFNKFIADKRRILVVVNDHTRPTPTAEILRQLNLDKKRVTTLIASGSHRPPGPLELQGIMGGETPPYGGKVAVHDCRDKDSLRFLGRTSRGTGLFVNSLLFEADGIISVASVEPHYFAGYTGGRKFLLPGLAGFESIAANHFLAADERAHLLALDGNPVHEDFMEALEMFGRAEDVFSIQAVLNQQSEVCYACAGEVRSSFERAVEYAEDVYVPKIPGRADIVISVNEPPLDIDLYQSQKAIQDVEYAVKQGGIIILVSNCLEGIGDEHFYKLLTSHEGTKEAGEARKFGYHKVVRLRNLLRNAKIFAVTSLSPSVLKAIGLTPYQNIQDAVQDATSIMGEQSDILVVLKGGMTVPVVSETA